MYYSTMFMLSAVHLPRSDNLLVYYSPGEKIGQICSIQFMELKVTKCSCEESQLLTKLFAFPLYCNIILIPVLNCLSIRMLLDFMENFTVISFITLYRKGSSGSVQLTSREKPGKFINV